MGTKLGLVHKRGEKMSPVEFGIFFQMVLILGDSLGIITVSHLLKQIPHK